MNPRILVVMDPTVPVDDRQQSIVRALEVAQVTGGHIDLLLVLHNGALEHGALASEAERRDHMADAHTWLQDAANRIRTHGFDVGVEVRWDHPRADAIVRAALELNSTLVIKQSQHDGAFNFGLFSNTDWDLAGGSPVPVLFTKSGSRENTGGILAAIELPDPPDADEHSTLEDVIIQTAISWGDRWSLPVFIGHAYSIAPDSPDISSGVHESAAAFTNGDPARTAGEQQRVSQFLRERGYSGFDVAVQQGPPWQVIPDVASNLNCALVVMGSRDHSRWERISGQAQSERALSDLSCDVLFVKDPAFVSPVDPFSEELIAIREH